MFDLCLEQYEHIFMLVLNDAEAQVDYGAGGMMSPPPAFRAYLVQGAHGEYRAVVGFDGLDEHRVSPDVNVSIGGSRKDQVLGSSVTRRHHRFLLPQVPKDPSFECETAPCRWREGHCFQSITSYLTLGLQ